MINLQNLRNYMSMILYELPSYLFKLNGSDRSWMHITNRNEKYIPAVQGTGINMLDDFTSRLRIAGHFPMLSNRLFRKAYQAYPFILNSEIEPCTSPEFSFIIGHRGNDKVRNLNLVLDSIAGQINNSVECIVIEQSAVAELENQLPKWVRYYHQKVAESDLYNRSSAFNFGVDKANADNLILHDNDLLVPACYTAAHLKLLSIGYDLVNLKRYIFGLSEEDSNQILPGKRISQSLTPSYVLQNAKGGGSLTIKRSAYERIGGFDDRFQGWGGEDNELWQRAQILNIYPFANLPLIHLWHKPQHDKRGGRHGGGLYTEKLIDELSAISIYERINNLQKIQIC